MRAENGTRTRNPQLGRLMLYQLSYFRIVWAGRDSNPRSRMATDLQSARFDRLPTYPYAPLWYPTAQGVEPCALHIRKHAQGEPHNRLAFYCPIPWNRTRLFQDSLLAIFVSSPLNDRFLLLRPLTSVRHQFGVQSTPTIPYGESFQVFLTIKETPIGFMCSTNCFCGPEGNRTLHDLLAREFRQPWYMQAHKKPI